jgi:hypothetical protein
MDKIFEITFEKPNKTLIFIYMITLKILAEPDKIKF